jgi:hypothetical protein
MNKKMNEPTKIIEKKLTIEELREESRKREARDEEMSKHSNILISGVPEELKKQYADLIKETHGTSSAYFTANMLEEEKKLRESRSIVDRAETSMMLEFESELFDVKNNWMATDKLINVANKGMKEEKRKERKKDVKEFFKMFFGINHFNKWKNKKIKDSIIKNMIQSYIGKLYLEGWKDKDIIAIFIDFIYYSISYQKWDLFMSQEEARAIAETYVLENDIQKPCCLKLQMFLTFYRYFEIIHK